MEYLIKGLFFFYMFGFSYVIWIDVDDIGEVFIWRGGFEGGLGGILI